MNQLSRVHLDCHGNCTCLIKIPIKESVNEFFNCYDQQRYCQMSWNDDGTQPSAVGWSQDVPELVDTSPSAQLVQFDLSRPEDEKVIEMFPESNWSVKVGRDKYIEDDEPRVGSKAHKSDSEPPSPDDHPTRMISAGMDDKILICAKCGKEESAGEDCDCEDIYQSGVRNKELRDKLAAAKNRAQEKVKPALKPDSQGKVLAADAMNSTKAMVARHTEFMQWYGKHVNNHDMEQDEKQAREYLTERIMRSKNESEKVDWEMVLEMFEKSMVDFKEKVRKDMAEMNSGVMATMDIKKVYKEIRFNGWLCFFVVIPADWFKQMNGAKAKMEKIKISRILDCRKFVIPPHQDEVVQLNPKLAIETDKAFAECWLQYENVLVKSMPYINGPCTKDIVFLNGAIEKPMIPIVATKLANIKKMADESVLDNCMLQTCIQFLPAVIYLEFFPDDRTGLELMKDRSLHLDRVKRVEKFCDDQNIYESRRATLSTIVAGGSAKQ